MSLDRDWLTIRNQTFTRITGIMSDLFSLTSNPTITHDEAMAIHRSMREIGSMRDAWDSKKHLSLSMYRDRVTKED